MLHVGVVGVGNMGFHHARIYSELAKEGKVQLVGVADANFEKAKDVAEKLGTRAFDDYRELVKEVDAVSVAVPTSLHRQVALEFIENGVHVLVEKPIAESVQSAEEIIKAAKRNDVVLMVGHVERFNPAVLRLKETVSRGMLGEIVTMNAKRVGPMVVRIADVGVIIDLAVHDIDVMSFLADSRVKEVYAKARNVKHPVKIEDYALILLGFEEGIDGVIETNRLTPHKTRTLNVVGTEGIAYLDYIKQSLTLYEEKWVYEAKIQKGEPLGLELEHFIECVKEGRKPLVVGEEGLHALEVAVKALESVAKDEVIMLG